MERIVRIAAVWLLVQLGIAAWAMELNIVVTVYDQSGEPVPGARVEARIHREGPAAALAETDLDGKATLSVVDPRGYEVTVTRDGMETVRREVDLSGGVPQALRVVLEPSSRHDTVDVKGTPDPVAAGSSPGAALTASTAKQLPGRPATVADALPLIPGVVREPGGGLVISASAEHRSALIVNSADVTDPATGQFGLTVPIDSVEVLNVYQTPYLAEYGRFTAGLVSVETRRGSDEWKWELNDPLPEFRIRSWKLRGLKDATPRLNFEGPLLAHKLYLSEGFEYEIRKTEVFTLPFPQNQKLEFGMNSFSQLDWIISSHHLVTATLHMAPERLGHVNLDYFNPIPVAPDASIRNFTGTVIDHLALWGGLLETTFSTTRVDAGVWPEGNLDMVFSPLVNSGSYFAQKSRNAQRISGASIYSFAQQQKAGTHNFKIGYYAASSDETGQVTDHPVDIVNAQNVLLERIAFPHPTQTFDVDDVEQAIFGQDHWIISPRLSVDLGIRTESQQVSGAFRVAPRGGLAWNPFLRLGTVVRAGFGLFYDRVPLNLYAFNRYPDQQITTYFPDGSIATGPTLYLNTLGQNKVKSPFISQRPVDGNFSPRSANWSLSLEQPINRDLRLRTSYVQHDSTGLAIMEVVPPENGSTTGAYLLNGAGEARFRQFETTARLRLSDERELFFSYVYTRARGDLNDFSTYLSTFPSPLIRPDYFGDLPGSIPNRFLLWGIFKIGQTVRLAPVLEYRTGFPYLSTNAEQAYVGPPDQSRFPNFWSADTRISKDIKVNTKYSVRLSLSGFNLTNHFNPEAVHYNTGDPLYGIAFGHRGRRFTGDFDVLF
ncbi:MAG TPA: carboxypeptidase regulatory-like domain-containing protein [Bryobacteraceae bacterium]|nr:carboxypeptidase regulatory-like domain-containing protein [Bryobacteraceae bacterium]